MSQSPSFITKLSKIINRLLLSVSIIPLSILTSIVLYYIFYLSPFNVFQSYIKRGEHPPLHATHSLLLFVLLPASVAIGMILSIVLILWETRKESLKLKIVLLLPNILLGAVPSYFIFGLVRFSARDYFQTKAVRTINPLEVVSLSAIHKDTKGDRYKDVISVGLSINSYLDHDEYIQVTASSNCEKIWGGYLKADLNTSDDGSTTKVSPGKNYIAVEVPYYIVNSEMRKSVALLERPDSRISLELSVKIPVNESDYEKTLTWKDENLTIESNTFRSLECEK